jgi:hypothetical protein
MGLSDKKSPTGRSVISWQPVSLQKKMKRNRLPRNRLPSYCYAHHSPELQAMRKFSRHRPPLSLIGLTNRQALQAAFGIVQDDVAALVGVSRATLTMDGQPNSLVSPGTRNMPFEAWERLIRLQQLVPAPFGPAPAAPAPTAMPSLPDEVRGDLDLRRRGMELKQYRLTQQLERARLRLSQAHRRLHALPALRAAFPDEQDHHWWVFFEGQANKWLREEGPQVRLLELKLRVLAFEIEQIQELLK